MKGDKYWPAVEVESIAKELIPQHHEVLAEANISYVFVEKMRSKGRESLGKLKLTSALENHMSGMDYVMFVNDETWKHLSKGQKVALVDHELCHGDGQRTSTGEMVYGIRNHDLEEFTEVVKRHGLWEPTLEHFAGVVGEQMPLPAGHLQRQKS